MPYRSAALQPRFLGANVVLARSIARIHETNLKKQGVLPLTFANPDDYSKISAGDIVETVGLDDLIRRDAGGKLKVKVSRADGSEEMIDVVHSMSEGQLKWLVAGSCLNHIAAAQAKAGA